MVKSSVTDHIAYLNKAEQKVPDCFCSTDLWMFAVLDRARSSAGWEQQCRGKVHLSLSTPGDLCPAPASVLIQKCDPEGSWISVCFYFVFFLTGVLPFKSISRHNRLLYIMCMGAAITCHFQSPNVLKIYIYIFFFILGGGRRWECAKCGEM